MSFNFGSYNDGTGQGGLSLPGDRKRIIKWGAIVVILIASIVLLSFLRSIFTNLLWFEGLGGDLEHRGVWI